MARPPSRELLERVRQLDRISVSWPFQEGVIPCDIFLALDEFQRGALHRKRSVELDEELRTDILTPEDLVVYKLIAWRKKDQVAVERLLTVQTTMDLAHVRRWAEHYRVAERLRTALDDAGIDETRR